MNEFDQTCHRSQQWQARPLRDGIAYAVAPADQKGVELSGFSGGQVNEGIAAKQSFCVAGAQCGECKHCPGGVRFARPRKTAADDGRKVVIQPQGTEYFFTKKLRLIRADCEQGSISTELFERLCDARKRKGAGNLDNPVASPKLFKVRSGRGAIFAHDRADHSFAANRIHRPDLVAVGLSCGSALLEHLVKNRAREPRAVDKRAVKIEDYAPIGHIGNAWDASATLATALS